MFVIERNEFLSDLIKYGTSHKSNPNPNPIFYEVWSSYTINHIKKMVKKIYKIKKMVFIYDHKKEREVKIKIYEKRRRNKNKKI